MARTRRVQNVETGVIEDVPYTQAEEAAADAALAAEQAPTPAKVTAERDRRMACFVFNGKTFDCRAETGSLTNITGAGALALAAIVQGAEPGDLRWSDPAEDFTWLANDNTRVLLDAHQTLAFASAAAAHRKRMIYAARALKDTSPIPADFTDDRHWSTA